MTPRRALRFWWPDATTAAAPTSAETFSSPQGGRDAHTREPRSGPGEGKKVRMRCTIVPPFYVRGFRTRSVVRGRENFLLPSRLLADD